MLWIRHGSITVEIIFSNLNSFFTSNWSKHNLLKYFSLNEIVLSSLLGFVYLSRAVKETCSFAELVMQFSFFFLIETWLTYRNTIRLKLSSFHYNFRLFISFFLSVSVCFISFHMCVARLFLFVLFWKKVYVLLS